MCLEDLRINRRKYTRVAPNIADANQSRRPGSRSTLQFPITDNGDPQLIIGSNDYRTALRVAITPNMIFNAETLKWQFHATTVFGFPVPTGTVNIFDISGFIYPWIVLSTTSLMADTITIEEAGNLIYGPWGFWSVSDEVSLGFQNISVTDIMIDADTMDAVTIPSAVLG